MDLPFPLLPCTEKHEPAIFLRHRCLLRAVVMHAEAWFPLEDIARLMGKRLDERNTRKLDADQRRTAWLLTYGEWQKCLLISESAVFALLIHHYIPENRALRRWLTQDVLPALCARPVDTHIDCPVHCQMNWQGTTLGTLKWRGNIWVKLRDMPEIVQVQVPDKKEGWLKRLGLLRKWAA
ncbi:BRO family, N-terminal domain protein [Pseudomonas caricapapayae]|uniref:BRO domain-containing protein n=1 Tax=Pseudomonas caricapapayae TaxID=46678 RepID=A0A0P9KV37_9PSED|nr:Bro-N domain-containing protein [Pseudomonas caricapapayae]KAA8698057.1 Bro-N domain-containing protein [Pseudomonas caricapapayae]KPW60345.1 BRO family, N-terminal domain protein [Pseudomonas caricapapayae]RMM09759.1 BRO family, N-terminal domain protein [Pseudomonas caricapapayae]RMV79520.1 BRO domain-containing protein [Pseudomonas caricapapayae]RMV92453.1 BRO family, N-terminal domain protein [Pseudomonas caricapapayae]